MKFGDLKLFNLKMRKRFYAKLVVHSFSKTFFHLLLSSCHYPHGTATTCLTLSQLVWHCHYLPDTATTVLCHYLPYTVTTCQTVLLLTCLVLVPDFAGFTRTVFRWPGGTLTRTLVAGGGMFQYTCMVDHIQYYSANIKQYCQQSYVLLKVVAI